jgi:hypothetical protein
MSDLKLETIFREFLNTTFLFEKPLEFLKIQQFIIDKLNDSDIYTVGDLIQKDDNFLRVIKNLGEGRVETIRARLAQHHLFLNMPNDPRVKFWLEIKKMYESEKVLNKKLSSSFRLKMNPTFIFEE